MEQNVKRDQDDASRKDPVNTIPAGDQPREYWQYEYDVASHYIGPLLRYWGFGLRNADVIDVGCGEGGCACSFHDLGARCVGFDIDRHRVAVAKALCEERTILFEEGSLYNEHLPFAGRQFDLVMLHDVFEHLERKQEMMARLRNYCKPSGNILITFPPYFSAYGAHQQHLQSTIGKLPFFHLLPFVVKHIMPRMKNENKEIVTEIQKIGRLRMGMKAFERIASSAELRIVKKQAYLISPNHIRFGLKPIPAGPLSNIPFLSELVCTGVVYLLQRPS